MAANLTSGRSPLDSTSVHEYTDQTRALAADILRYAEERLRMDPVPLDAPLTKDQLDEIAGGAITPQGRGGVAALDLFAEKLAPARSAIQRSAWFSA